MIEIDDLEISLGVGHKLKTESFEISSGLWALIGRNGSGKSSFLNAVLQNKSHSKGNIALKGISVENWNANALAKEIAVVYTKPTIFGNYTVKEVIELGRIPHTSAFGKLTAADFAVCEKAVNTLKISHLVSKKFSVLSDGEKQLVMIARALAQETSVIILDEPTAFLDVVNRSEIIKVLKEVSVNHNKTILFSTHDVALIPSLCEGLLWIDNNVLKASIAKHEFKSIIDKIFISEI
ncbi:MAG: ABC transporter ATP-binding protein [Crocinitomicaceae bacterium]